MSDDSTARVTLRGEFLRAERHLARAVEAESQVERLTALADGLAARIARVEALVEAAKDFDEVGMGWVSVSEIFAALAGFPPTRVDCADCGPVDPDRAEAHDEHHSDPERARG